MGHLVISRKIGERIIIGDGIEILVSAFYKNRVDIAIKAPKEVKILKKKSRLEEERDSDARNKSR